MKKISIFCFILLSAFFSNIREAAAQGALEEELRAMKIQLEAMQKRINELEDKVADQQSQIAERPAVQEVAPAAKTAKWTPDIGVIADIVYKQDSAKVDAEGADRVDVRELELVLASDIDPFSRLDATIAFSTTEAPNLEEAYMTRFGLPLNTTGRLGKFKPKVGKVIPLHRDSLDTVDEPLVIQRYFGAEGFSKTGLDFSLPLDIPWPLTHQLSFGILEGGNGEEGTAFGEVRRRPTIYSHLKNYAELTDTTGFELGLSHMAGSRDTDTSFEVQVLAADATLTHNFNANQNMKLQAEAFNLYRKDSFLLSEEPDASGDPTMVRREIDGNLWGWHGLADLRFHPQWSAGFRYDNVQLVDNPLANPRRTDIGYTGYLTFHQSEFARWRAQFTHTDLATGLDDNTFYLQGTFAIGDHKHKLQ